MDPIANMLVQIKNAGSAGKKETQIKYSKINLAILNVFKKLEIVSDFNEEKNENQKYPNKILVRINYNSNGEPKFSSLNKISTPGRRVYIGAKKIYMAKKGKTEILLSTSKGMISGTEAIKHGVGGELICEVQKWVE